MALLHGIFVVLLPEAAGDTKTRCVCVLARGRAQGAELPLCLAICFFRRLKGPEDCGFSPICLHFYLMGHHTPSLSHYEERHFINKLSSGTHDLSCVDSDLSITHKDREKLMFILCLS